jgi:hypothetical protein
MADDKKIKALKAGEERGALISVKESKEWHRLTNRIYEKKLENQNK